MEVTRRSYMTGKETTLDLNITESQIDAYNKGTLLQNAFPNLSADEREFYKNGTAPGEWEAMFGEEEDQSYDED